MCTFSSASAGAQQISSSEHSVPQIRQPRCIWIVPYLSFLSLYCKSHIDCSETCLCHLTALGLEGAQKLLSSQTGRDQDVIFIASESWAGPFNPRSSSLLGSAEGHTLRGLFSIFGRRRKRKFGETRSLPGSKGTRIPDLTQSTAAKWQGL